MIDPRDRSFTTSGVLTVCAIAAIALLVGVLVGFVVSAPAPTSTSESQQTYTCTMHPDVRLSDPDALCPICKMALVPAVEQADAGVLETVFSENAKAMMAVETAPVERRDAGASVSLLGEIDYDETRIASVAAWAPGRLDRLFVDYTGMPIRQGDHMAELYSPELLAAQEELILTARTAANLKSSDSEFVRESALANAEAAREKMRLLGLTAEQIDGIIAGGKAQDRVTIYSPVSGIVIERFAAQGQYVKTGEKIYSIADLSQVWVRLEAYESDLAWLRYGQTVNFTTQAHPGETFTGNVAFISPVLDERTRTIRVRVNAPNLEGRLLPGMFVQARIIGGAADALPAGKWVCPMHPSVVRDQPDSCEICGMPLEESEGASIPQAEAPLLIPDSAVLWTGERSVVYVSLPGQTQPTYQLRQVVLGPKVGSSYIVRDGLATGELVVVRGAFKIDSERQLRQQVSMMSPPEDLAKAMTARTSTFGDPLPATFAEGYWRMLAAYLTLQEALAGDREEDAAAAVTTLQETVTLVDADELDQARLKLWLDQSGALAAALDEAATAGFIENVRVAFNDISKTTVVLVRHFGGLEDRALRLVRCPMAFDNAGASWLQTQEQVSNPYYGAMMMRCGSELEQFPPSAADESAHDHE